MSRKCKCGESLIDTELRDGVCEYCVEDAKDPWAGKSLSQLLGEMAEACDNVDALNRENGWVR